MGRAAQIATRDGERMARAAEIVEKAIRKQADQVGRLPHEYLALQAAEANLGQGIQKYIDIVATSGTVTKAATSAGIEAYRATADAAVSSSEKQRAANAELTKSIYAVHAAAEARKQDFLAQEKAGTLPKENLRPFIQQLREQRDADIQTLKTAAAQERAANEVAEAEEAAIARRRAAFEKLRETVARTNYENEQKQIASAQRIVDSQNGLTATYREQLRVLQQLRDAGHLTPQQFTQARVKLEEAQPVNREAAATSAAEEAAAKAAAARALALAQAGSSAAYAAAQSQVYAAYLIAEAAASNQVAAAQARQAEVASQVAAANERTRTSQEAAYQTKVAYIAKVNEEAAALFRTKDAQRELDAAAAGVGAKQAAQLAKFSGDRDLASTIKKAIDAEERLAATLGKTQAEIFKQDAAERQLSNTLEGKIGRYERLATANQKAKDAATQVKSNEAFIQSLEREVAVMGKARSEIVALELAKRGLTERGAPLVKALQDVDAKTGQLGKSAFASKNALLTLNYTISDVVASAASGISPLTILLQQGGQVAQVGLANVAKAVPEMFALAGKFITPFTVGIGAATAAVGVLAVGLYQGAERGKEFANALLLSGNYAGQTAQSFTDMAKRISASGEISISAAREFGAALAATGQIGPVALEKATDVAARFGAATGKNAKEVAADFASMGEDAFRWATEHNKSLNFVTAGQLQHIRTLQEQGKAVEAQILIYGLLDTRFKGTEANLGSLDRYLRTTGGTWKNFWDWVYDVGRPQTIESKIADTQTKIARLVEAAKNPGLSGPRFGPQIAAAQELLGDQLKTKLQQDDAAKSAAANTETSKRAATALTYYRDAERAAKTQVGLTRELAEEEKHYQELVKDRANAITRADPNAPPPVLPTDADRLRIQKRIRESYEDKKGAGNANAVRKSTLDQDLKLIRDQFNVEKQALEFSQQELQALYNVGQVSVVDYYDQKRRNIETGVEKELTALKAEEARIDKELRTAKFKDPQDKIQVETKRNDVRALQDKVAAEASQKLKLSNIEQAETYRQLQQRVLDFQASLVGLAGDEREVARIRDQINLSNLKKLQEQTAGLPGGGISDEQLAQQHRLSEAASDFAEIQRKVGLASADAGRAEELFLLRAERSGLGLRETEEQLYILRSAQLSQLGQLRDKAQALADAFPTNAQYAQVAATLSLDFAKAVDNIDAGINRLREASKSLASEMAGTIGSGIANFSDLYSARAQKAAEDLAKSKGEFDERINQLEGYLAKTQDANDKARLREKIKALQSQRDATRESGNIFLKTVERDILAPLAKQVVATITKVAITEPLEKSIRGFLDKAIKLGGFEDVAGGKDTKQAQEILARETNTVAMSDSTRALLAFAQAAESARAAATGGSTSLKIDNEGWGFSPNDAGYSPAKDSQKAYEELAKSQGELNVATTTQTAAATASAAGFQQAAGVLGGFSSVVRFASEALRLFQATTSVSSAAGSGGGGLFSWLGSLFGGGGGGFGTGASYGNQDYGAFFHSGGVVGSSSDIRAVPTGAFVGASRYHDGGVIEAQRRVLGLAHNEVPAILLREEEVLRANDPRHRNNLRPETLARIVAAEGTRLPAAARLPAAPGTGRPAVKAAAPARVASLHLGGVAGAATTTRIVPIAVFAGAPRFHSGGIVAAAPIVPEQRSIFATGELNGAPSAQTASAAEAAVGFKEAAEVLGTFSSAARLASQATSVGGTGGTGGAGGIVDFVSKLFKGGAAAPAIELKVDKTPTFGTDSSRYGYSPAKDSQEPSEALARTEAELTDATTLQAQAVGYSTAATDLASESIGGLSSASRYAAQALALIQGTSSASAAGEASGFASWFGKLFGGGGGGGGAGAAEFVDYGAFFHAGGVVGAGSDVRSVPAGTFVDARRYHTGGVIDEQRRLLGLAHNEVPAILLRNEEVLRRDDPRHRDNLAPEHRFGSALAERAGRAYQPPHDAATVTAPVVAAPVTALARSPRATVVAPAVAPVTAMATDMAVAAETVVPAVASYLHKISLAITSDDIHVPGLVAARPGSAARKTPAVPSSRYGDVAGVPKGFAESVIAKAVTASLTSGATFAHAGDVVAEGRAGLSVPAAFVDARRYHDGGVIEEQRRLLGLAHNEVPAILLRNEEVLRADDPRHSNNIRPETLAQIIAAGAIHLVMPNKVTAPAARPAMNSARSGASRGATARSAGASPVAKAAAPARVASLHGGGIVGVATPARAVPISVFVGAPRFHSGGVVGMSANSPQVLRRDESVRREERRWRDDERTSERSGGGFNYAPTFNVPPNTDHRTLNQIGQFAYEGAQRAYQRNN